MTIIHNGSSVVQKLLAPRGKSKGALKWSQYVLLLDTEDGCLIWNTLTSVLALLENVRADEAMATPEALADAEALYAALFLVPSELDEYKRLNQFEGVLRAFRKQQDSSGYTIFTTLACNARCGYCYEKDVPKLPMSADVALDTVKFIQRTSKGGEVKLHWFGGEPLVGVKNIDLICSALAEAGTEYTSAMISNGYLFDEDMIRRAVELWKLERVQITLDGTEEVYNRTKNYVNAEGSAYRKVLRNIALLAEKGIKVTVRLNLSLDNAADLLLLADELGKRFAGKENISVYARALYEYKRSEDIEIVNRVIAAYKQLDGALIEKRLRRGNKLPVTLPLNSCMADNDGSYVITPSGGITKCEHYSVSDFVGDIWQGVTDTEKVAWYKQRVPRTEKCKTCFYAPTCMLLSCCDTPCCELFLQTIRYDLETSMKTAYRSWKEKGEAK